MCVASDIEDECKYLEGLVLAAFEGFKNYHMGTFHSGDEKKTDWIEAFLEGVGSRLRMLEKKGKLADPSKDNVNAE